MTIMTENLPSIAFFVSTFAGDHRLTYKIDSVISTSRLASQGTACDIAGIDAKETVNATT